MEEKRKDYELIIKAYQGYAEQERKSSDEQYDLNYVLEEEFKRKRKRNNNKKKKRNK